MAQDLSNKHFPVSVPKGIPWHHINRNDAIRACKRLNDIYWDRIAGSGMRFDLISTQQWSYITLHIERETRNYSPSLLRQGNNKGDGPEGYMEGDCDEKARHLVTLVEVTQ